MSRRKIPWFWAIAVFTLSVLQRVALWWLYQPVLYGDTGSYRRLAAAVLRGWRGYDGSRTPGYPLFLAIFKTDTSAWVAQMALGVGITLLMFLLGWQISSRPWFGGATALAHTFNLGQIFFEANLLTETLTTFWVIATVAGTVAWLQLPRYRTRWFAASLGIVASFAWLSRPLFIYLPVWLIFFVGISIRNSRIQINTAHVAAFLLPVVGILAVWVNFIHSNYKNWGLSTMTGYNLIQHTGHFFEYVPDEYAALRDTYLKYRDAHIETYGTQTNTIWEAIPEMQQASGMSFFKLSRTLTSISLRLIWEHPLLYLRNVVKGWWFFWRAPVYWSAESLRWPQMSSWIDTLVLGQRLVLVATNLSFVICTLLAIFWPRARQVWKLSSSLWLIAGTIWLGSILQTLVDHGDNPRFLVPMQSLAVLWMMWVVFKTVERATGRPKLEAAR